MSCSVHKGSLTREDLGRAIRKLRKERRMTIEALAFAAPMHPTYLSQIERGLGNPTLEKLDGLASALGVPFSVVATEIQKEAESAQAMRDAKARMEATWLNQNRRGCA